MKRIFENTETKTVVTNIFNKDDEKMVEHLLRKMIGVGDDVELDDNLKETPHRVLKLWTEMTEGYREDPAKHLEKSFPINSPNLADDEDGIFCPKSVSKGKIIKAIDENGNKRYDFQFINKRGYKTTIEGLSDKFNPEYWNYAKLISGVLRYGMPIDQVMKLVGGLELNSESINTWKMGVERALKKYLPEGTKAKGQKCPNCGQETLIYQEGCLICTSCGTSRCG